MTTRIIPPEHHWYQCSRPEGSMARGFNKQEQTILARFRSQLRVEPQRIILRSDLPVHLRPYHTSPIQEKEIKGQVEKLLQVGLTKESNSPYPAPVTLAFKRDGDQNNYYEPVDEARELALKRTIDYHIKNKIRYDARCIEKKFNPGDLVVYEEFQYPNTRKLSSPFSGSCEIIKQCSEVTYEINKPNSLMKKDSQIVHISKLRCFERERFP
ncbi:integrase catalytic domain-containing protein [Trichonephila clavipes]|nr:integrase catalytic domain-containing protein [Trichonephila clavipes]